MPADQAATVVRNGRAMATEVSVTVTRPSCRADAAVEAALGVFAEVDRTCSRFDPASDLSLVNADPEAWQAVAPTCFAALVEAHAAHRRTNGRFDPRVLQDLLRLGYRGSYRTGPPDDPGAAATEPRPPLHAWRPEFRRADRLVRLGAHPVDLGGIAKGLSVRWAGECVSGAGTGSLVEAGGDLLCRGSAPDGGPWRIRVEDPATPSATLALLALTDAAVATSSIRIRRWGADGADVHHLIDPGTGLPGGDGLLAVTVVAPDPAEAEVWSKTLFLAGARGVATSARHFGVAALWVAADGSVGMSPTMHPLVMWQAAA